MRALYDEWCFNNLVAVGTTACNSAEPVEPKGYGGQFASSDFVEAKHVPANGFLLLLLPLPIFKPSAVSDPGAQK